MSSSHGARADELKRKFVIVYSVMFLLPVLYFTFLVWDLLNRMDLPPEPLSAAMLRLVIGIPAGLLMSLAAFFMMYRSLKAVSKTAHSAEAFLKELKGDSAAGPDDGGDEAARISYYVTDMISELRQRLTEVDRYAQELHAANKKLVDLAVNDGLTGLYNQKHAKHLLTTEFERAKRFSHPLSILLLDLDSFKQFNDTYGHIMGDKALRDTARMIREQVRRVDLPARYGGEEFLVILPETGLAGAVKIADRIRQSLAAYAFVTGRPDEPGRLTASIGVTAYTGEPITESDLLAKADACMYEAKRSGKNRVCVEAPAPGG